MYRRMRSQMNSEICGLTCRSPHVAFIFIEINLVAYGIDVIRCPRCPCPVLFSYPESNSWHERYNEKENCHIK